MSSPNSEEEERIKRFMKRNKDISSIRQPFTEDQKKEFIHRKLFTEQPRDQYQ